MKHFLIFICLLLLAAPALAGSVGSPSTPLQIPANSLMVFEGDSYTSGFNGGTVAPGCTPTAQNTCWQSWQATSSCAANHSGSCFADLVTSFYKGREQNTAIGAKCLQNSTYCATGALRPPPAITMYATTILPAAGPSTYFFLEYANDPYILSVVPTDNVTLATYIANYETIVDALLSAGTPSDHIVVSQIPLFASAAFEATQIVWQYNTALAQFVRKNNLRLALTYDAVANCILTCYQADRIHPNAQGHANIAAAYEQATYENAVERSYP